MVSFLDPRLLTFYRERDHVAGWRLLRDLGITHIYTPDYSLPPMYNSVLLKIIGCPRLSKLVFSNGGYQVYELTAEKNKAESEFIGRRIDFSPGLMTWTQEGEFVFGGRKRLSRYNALKRVLKPGEFSFHRFNLPLFRRDWSMTVQSDPIRLPIRRSTSGQRESDEQAEYRLELELEGHAFAQIYLTYLDIHNNQIDEGAIGEIAIGQPYPKRIFLRRFTVGPEVSAVRVGVVHHGNTKVRVTRAALSSVL
jgi:hypothetical protein